MLRVEARAHFDQGVELAARGEFERALAEFEAAHRNSPNFAVLYNIGQAHIELGHPLFAIAALEHRLEDRRAETLRLLGGTRRHRRQVPVPLLRAMRGEERAGLGGLLDSVAEKLGKFG
jgi:iron complex outermembrane receptor protein